ncbi:tetratricopeptide repeat protein [Methanomassiliicoccus luminyensis]|uniref:tetratricopeptide repeat protein n=1 Tax=Methanomassiliicoccus luminyensis TaxID=1080712 RepID=UPI00035E0E5B|nr:tetratricopeptide repeat protein [Methanomassiliicoccus luminyensis]
MNRASKKSLLTARERIVLHILSYQKFLQDSDAPMAITQEGIADAVDVGRNNVSKAVNVLADEGIVEVHTKHVKGFASVKKVYFLTQKGFQEGLAFKAEIESTKVVIVDFDGKEITDEVGKLSKYLPKRYTFLEIALGVTRGRFDCSSFHHGKVREERRYVDYTDRKPSVRTFFGRQEELKKLNDFITSETARIMVVYGIPGIGKTTLLAKFVQDVRERHNVFWYRVHEWVNLKILLSPIAEFLSQMGRKGLERYLSRTETPSVGEVSSILETELKDLPAVFILDDVQKADQTVHDFLAAMVGVLESLPHVSMIFTSREIPSFYSRSVVFKGEVVEMMLDGLDMDSSFRLIRNRELPESELMAIYTATRGHPLFLELIDSPKSALGKNVRMFIEQEVYAKLDPTERRILEIASIFRYPVLIDAFFSMEEGIAKEMGFAQKELEYKDYMVDYDTIDQLLNKSLMHESTGRMIGMHDLLRDFFYSRLAPRSRMAYHKAASRYYLQDRSAPSHVEAMYHCLMAKEYSTATKIAASYGRDIIAKGYGLPFGPLLAQLREQCEHIDNSEKMEILLLEGDIYEVKGEWDQAVVRFDEAGTLADPEKDKRLLAEINRRIGGIYLRRSLFDEAETYLVKSLGIAQAIQDTHTLVDIYYDLGGVFQSRGRNQEALSAFSMSRELAQTVGDDVGRGKALYGIGRVHTDLLDHNRAITYKKEALEIMEKTGDVDNIARVYVGIGHSLLDIGNFREGANYLEKAIDIGKASGNLELQGHAMRHAAAAHIELEEFGAAEDLLTASSKIFEKLNIKLLVAHMHLMRGYLYEKKQEWEWGKDEFNLALDMLRKMNKPSILGRWLFWVSKEYAKNGERSAAYAMLSEAQMYFQNEPMDQIKKDIEEALAQNGA